MINIEINKIMKQLGDLIGYLCSYIGENCNFGLILESDSLLLSPPKRTSLESSNRFIMLNGKLRILCLWGMLTLPIRASDITKKWN